MAKPNPEKRARVLELYNQGLGPTAIARRMGITVAGVKYYTDAYFPPEGVKGKSRRPGQNSFSPLAAPATPRPPAVQIEQALPTNAEILAELSPADQVTLHRFCAAEGLTVSQVIGMLLRRLCDSERSLIG